MQPAWRGAAQANAPVRDRAGLHSTLRQSRPVRQHLADTEEGLFWPLLASRLAFLRRLCVPGLFCNDGLELAEAASDPGFDGPERNIEDLSDFAVGVIFKIKQRQRRLKRFVEPFQKLNHIARLET